MKRVRERVSNGEHNMPSVDRLSGLPDAVLCHILSSLSTKHSVATSTLSRRWRFLWTEVPILEFKLYDLYRLRVLRADVPHLRLDDHYKGHLPRFLDIINRILTRYNVKAMDNFCLSFDGPIEDSKLISESFKTWISNVIARKVQNIDLCLDSTVVLPQCLFTCNTLVSVSLDNCEIPILLPETVCNLPSLKKLILCGVFFNGDENLCCLISCCPVLENLVMDEICDVACCSISSPTLKWLEVGFVDHDHRKFHDNCRLEINAPALRYLKLQDSLSQNISAEALTSLIEAEISLFYVDELTYPGYVFEFLDGLCNVKCLDLTIDYREFLDSTFATKLKMFYNLSELELNADWRFISKFLESAVNLQVLIIGKVDSDLERWMEPHVVPTCLLSHLRTIKIVGFECLHQEFEMVRYLLRNAQVLKTMEIEYFSEEDANICEFYEISQFERGSEECEIVLRKTIP